MTTPHAARQTARATTSLPLAGAAVALRADDDLDTLLASAETALAELGATMRRRDPVGMEQAATSLRSALQEVAKGFSAAARRGTIAPDLVTRLTAAREAAATLQDSAARASYVLDHTVAALRPAGAAAIG